jgi:hypothetical protein
VDYQLLELAGAADGAIRFAGREFHLLGELHAKLLDPLQSMLGRGRFISGRRNGQ